MICYTYSVLTLLALSSSSALAQLCFQERVIVSSLFDPERALVADIDQDGDLDIITTNSRAPSMQSNVLAQIMWYENDSVVVPAFTERFIGDPGFGLESSVFVDLQIADFNNDGFPDIFGNLDDGPHFWFENNGAPSFGFTRRDTGWGGGSPRFFADLNGDGNTDIVQDNTRWLRYTGTGSTHFSTTNFTNSFTGTLTGAADIDFDGDIDLITNGGFWYENDGNSSPTFTERLIHASASGMTLRPVDFGGFIYLLGQDNSYYTPNSSTPPAFFRAEIAGATGPLSAVDLDQDNALDLLDVNGTWYRNTFASVFFSPVEIHPSASGPWTAADIDGDGDIDLANPNQSVWYRNQVTGPAQPVAFTEESYVGVNSSSTPNMNQGQLHDFDQDGDLDALQNIQQNGAFTWFINSTIDNISQSTTFGDLQSAINQANSGDMLFADAGVFQCVQTIQFQASEVSVIGRSEIYTTTTVSLGSGALAAASEFDVSLRDLEVPNNSPFKVPSITGALVTVGDVLIEDDASLDIAGDLRINPRGTFIWENSGSTLGGAKQIRSADIDQDGDIDTIILKETGQLAWFERAPQDNQNWSATPVVIDTGSLTFNSLEVADLNSDGLIDLVAHDDSFVYVAINNGFGAMPQQFTIVHAGTSSPGGDLVLGDMDNDSDIDIIQSGLGFKSGFSTKLFTNNGASVPGFTSTNIFSPRFFVQHLNVIDLEDDGNLDVLIAQDPPLNDESGIVVLRNLGTQPATFSTQRINFYPPGIPTRVYGGDFDADGDADILALYSKTGLPRIMLLENRFPQSGFDERVLDLGGPYGEDLAIADFDQDGDLDFVSSITTLFRNSGTDPVSFRKETDRSTPNEVNKVLHAVNYNNDGSIDLIRHYADIERMEWVRNQFQVSAELGNGSTLSVSGGLDLVSTDLTLLPDSSLDVEGSIIVDPFSELIVYSDFIAAENLLNLGSIEFQFLNSPGALTVLDGNYTQITSTSEGEQAGTMQIQSLFVITNIGGVDITGSAELGGGLAVRDFVNLMLPIPGDEVIGPVVRAQSFVPGRDRFDVVSTPVLPLIQPGGEQVQGTLVPVYSDNEITLLPITLDELLFTQNPFSSEGVPNDAVLFDVTGAHDGSPDGDIDLIVAIPEIPGVSPNGAVAVFQGSLNVNGFEMITVSLYTGSIVDSPGSVEVGFFDNDSIPDIAFANQGLNEENNDVHFLHMDSSDPTPFRIAPLPAFEIGAGFTVTDLASDDFVTAGEGTDDLLLGVQSNSSGTSMVQTIAFDSMNWDSCEVDVDDIDTVSPGRTKVTARGVQLADIVVTSPDVGQAIYFVNSGDFENMIPIVIPTGTQPGEVLAQDLDGDGEPEVVVICRGDGGNQGVLTVSRNLGGNSFAPPVNLVLGDEPMVNPSPISLALSDVDDDGDRDIVLVSVNDSGDQRVRVIRNTTIPGNGLTFASVIDAPDQPSGVPLIVRSADLDGDSPNVADDIVVLVDPSSGLLARQGSGGSLNSIDLSGNFCAPDLNRDGVLDFFDISAFLSSFASGDTIADFTFDGALDFFDISAFLNKFNEGCP